MGPKQDRHYEDLVRAELPGLMRYATALCGDPEQARDLVSEVLVRAYIRWDRVRDTDRPAAYLMRMVTNEFLSWRRRWSTRWITAVNDDTLNRFGPVEADHSVRISDRADLDQRLAKLPRRQQAALVLRFFESLDYPDIAAVLGCAEGTARSAVSRGLATLRLNDITGTAAPSIPMESR